MAKEDMRSYSTAELKAMRARGETFTRPDAPEYELDEEFWKNARVVMPPPQGKTHTGIRLDTDVLNWFKAQGRGWQTRMNAVLRSYVASQNPPPSRRKRVD
jgi:uncharacterized protein (DUF4415 family)